MADPEHIVSEQQQHLELDGDTPETFDVEPEPAPEPPGTDYDQPEEAALHLETDDGPDGRR